MVGLADVFEGGCHEAFGVGLAFFMEVVSDGAGRRLGDGCEIVEVGDVGLYLLVIAEMPEV